MLERHERLPAVGAALARPVVVFRWDLDKTYLRSRFDTVGQLLRTGFEGPEDKVEVPGVVELIRGLKPTAERSGRTGRIFFLSASPPQIGRAIREKLALDGVPYDGIVFKDQLHHLVRGKFRNLREQVGFKLGELLRSRHEMPADAEEVLFGDDWESDAIVYSIYADTLAGRLDTARLREILARIHVDPKIVEDVIMLARAVTPADAVRRIYINLERRTPPVNFRHLGPRVVPTFNYLQTAAVLWTEGHLDFGALEQVARALVERAGYTPARLANSLADLRRRGHLAADADVEIRGRLGALGLAPAPPRRLRWRARVRGWLRRRRAAAPPRGLPAPVEPLDYDLVLEEWERARRAGGGR
jgi:hypothetical protein